MRILSLGAGVQSTALYLIEALRTTGSCANRDLKQSMFVHSARMPLVQIEFDSSAHTSQATFNFAAECMGVCGV